jgi:preprotein translocase subunit SecD
MITLILAIILTFSTTFVGLVKKVNLGLDLQGGFEILYKIHSPYEDKQGIPQEELNVQTASIIGDRIDILGVNKPDISIEGENYLRVQLPGISNKSEARTFLNTGGNITIRDKDNELLFSSKDFSEVGIDNPEDGVYYVTIGFASVDELREIVNQYNGETLVIWLDYTGQETYVEEISGESKKIIFHGTLSIPNNQSVKAVSLQSELTKKEVENLRRVLATGDLPAQLEEEYSRSVSAKFGEDSLKNVVTSGIIALALVFLFMLWRYRILGLLSIVSLLSYLYITVIIIVVYEITLTLTGLAALILGIGIAVDANILAFEEIKRSNQAKSLKTTLYPSLKKTVLTIIDANVTSLIAASGLFLFGAGIVKGFAVMLVVTMFTSFLTTVGLSFLLLHLLAFSELYDRHVIQKQSSISRLLYPFF